MNRNELRKALTQELENRDVEDADEIADSVVEVLYEDGWFDSSNDDEG